MKKIIEGVVKFSEAKEERAHLSQLAEGQKPEALFITCCDSRLDPALVTQSNPGKLFVLRNVGNIVPPSDAADDAVTAALEFAIHVLKVRKIVVCGHSGCGAIEAAQKGAASCPHVEKWVRHACPKGEKENVLKQLEHLKTYPFIQNVDIHGWWLDIWSASVHAYDPEKKQFVQIGQ